MNIKDFYGSFDFHKILNSSDNSDSNIIYLEPLIGGNQIP